MGDLCSEAAGLGFWQHSAARSTWRGGPLSRPGKWGVAEEASVCCLTIIVHLRRPTWQGIDVGLGDHT